MARERLKTEAQKRGRRSSGKGSAGEREVAALLQAWWRNLEPETVFVRTPRSGGWLAGRIAFKACGDLMANDKAPRWPFVVEVKRRNTWSEKGFFAGRRSPVWHWWKQAVDDAARQGGTPMLVFRKDRAPWIVMIPDDARTLNLPTELFMSQRLPAGLQFVRVLPLTELLSVDPTWFARA